MKMAWKIIIAVLAVTGAATGGWLFWQKYIAQKPCCAPSSTPTKTITIPEEILTNKFGFLGAGVEDIITIKDYGAGWLRPHPGPFLWDAMQKEPGTAISFEATDKIVKASQDAKIGLLATLWPFADFDQKNRPNAEQCQVSANDEFLMKNDTKGRGDYLPLYRCNPTDWEKYQTWVTSVVERYDGDGQDDLAGLVIPIKYWEVMNEPDLQSPAGDDRLDFYKEDANAYAQLLVKTSQAIRQADPASKVLIAGSAGGNPEFLNFYRQVFQNPETLTAFDLGNIHCISNDQNNDFNVSAYKKMLAEFNLNVGVWVTEAENMKGKTLAENADWTNKSTSSALVAGAERIFYTRYNFEDFRRDMSEKTKDNPASLEESQKLYREIFNSAK